MQPNFNFTPFPVLETERLILRQPIADDDQPYFVLRSSSEVNKYIGRTNYQTIEEAQNFIERINKNIAENESIFWSIIKKENKELIGTICLWNLSVENKNAEIGYEMHPDFHGKGFMQEAVSKVIDYGFSVMNVQTIFGVPSIDNIKSKQLLEKFNFKRDFEADKLLHNDEIGIQVYYALSR